MDETTKVIIATISGFVIAFFAEPVKIYFQNKSKLQNLRIALYKELVSNYVLLKDYDAENIDSDSVLIFAEIIMRTESYKYSLENDPIGFYELVEATAINSLYGTLNLVSGLPTMQFLKTGKVIEPDEIPNVFKGLIEVFLETMVVRVHEGRLNKRILRN